MLLRGWKYCRLGASHPRADLHAGKVDRDWESTKFCVRGESLKRPTVHGYLDHYHETPIISYLSVLFNRQFAVSVLGRVKQLSHNAKY